jgi:Transposase DDE domain
VHLLVDSTGLKLCSPGEWLVEKHGTKRRRSWRKLHIGVDADTGRIVASERRNLRSAECAEWRGGCRAMCRTDRQTRCGSRWLPVPTFRYAAAACRARQILWAYA